MLPKCLKDAQDHSKHLFTDSAKKILEDTRYYLSIVVDCEEKYEEEYDEEISFHWS